MADYEETLLKVLLDIAKKLNYVAASTTIKPMSSDGTNCTSQLFEATISAAGKDDINVFGKVASMGDDMRSIRTGNIFTAEIYYYAQLLKKYQDIETKHNVPEEHRLNTPIFYGANDEYMKETLVLENLAAKGYVTYDRLKPIDWKFASQSIKQLAILHALSIALSKYDPVGFEETKTWLSSVYKFNDMSDMMKDLLSNMLNAVRDENKARMSVFIKTMLEANDFDKYFEPVKTPVIVHGDYRISNMMYKVNDDHSYRVVPLDYQAARQGSPLTDLLFLIFSSTDKKFRDQYFESSIELYYKEICDALRRLDVDPDEVYSREDFDYEYQKVLDYGLIVGIFVLPLVTMEADTPTKPVTLSDMNIQPNNLYKERLNEVIDDYIAMGIL